MRLGKCIAQVFKPRSAIAISTTPAQSKGTSQELPGAARQLRAAKSYQEPPRASQLPGQPGPSGTSQVLPGTTRSSQELQGAARSCQENTLKLRPWGNLGSPLGTLGRRLGALCEAMPSQRVPRTPPRVPEGSILAHFGGSKR